MGRARMEGRVQKRALRLRGRGVGTSRSGYDSFCDAGSGLVVQGTEIGLSQRCEGGCVCGSM